MVINPTTCIILAYVILTSTLALIFAVYVTRHTIETLALAIEFRDPLDPANDKIDGQSPPPPPASPQQPN